MMIDSMINFSELATENEYNINKLEILLKFMSVVESSGNKIKTNFDRFNSFLVQQLKRGLTPQEQLNISEAFYKYISSEPGTNERIESLNEFMNLKFLNPTTTTNLH